MKESDLYLPIKRFLESQDFTVKSEIHGCDVLAFRGEEEPVIIELKLTLNLNLILQAVDRLSLSGKVYVAIPKACAAFKKQQHKQVVKLIRMLGLGLLTVDPKARIGCVAVICDPGEYRPRKSRMRRERLLGEFVQRVGDPNNQEYPVS